MIYFVTWETREPKAAFAPASTDNFSGNILNGLCRSCRLACCRCRCHTALYGTIRRILQPNPTCAGFQLAPAIFNLNDCKRPFSGVLSRLVIAHCRTLADAQIRNDNLNHEGNSRKILYGVSALCGSLCWFRY